MDRREKKFVALGLAVGAPLGGAIGILGLWLFQLPGLVEGAQLGGAFLGGTIGVLPVGLACLGLATVAFLVLWAELQLREGLQPPPPAASRATGKRPAAE